MKIIFNMVAAATLVFSGLAYADDAQHEIGFDSFDLSLDDVDLTSDVTNTDFEFIFVDQDKESPDQVAQMISSEKKAWTNYSKKMDKGLWNLVRRHLRSFRTGFRHSFYNGYRYRNRYNHGYNYNGYGRNDSYSRSRSQRNHRNAYRYSYRTSYRRYNRPQHSNIYRSGYNNGYRRGYNRGAWDHSSYGSSWH